MWRSLTSLSLMAVVSIFVAGCSIVRPAESKVQSVPPRQMSMEQLREIESFFVECETSVPTLDPKGLKAGQHIQILTGGMPDNKFPESVAPPTEVSGTVKMVSTDHVVLQDVMMTKKSRSKQKNNFTSRIPYISRLGNSSGVARESTAIPGELTIELASILHAGELTEVEFGAMQKNAKPQRIGVDFDFNIVDDSSYAPLPPAANRLGLR